MDDTSRYGRVRKAVVGEVPTHLAMCDMRTGDGLIVHGVDMAKQGAERTVDFGYVRRTPMFDIPMIHIHHSTPKWYRQWEQRNLLEVERRRRAEQNKKRFLFWVVVILFALFCIAFYIDHFTTLTTITQ